MIQDRKENHGSQILSILSLLLIALGACEVLDPEEKTPSFIEVRSPSLATDPSIEGSNSHAIEYGWVYVDDQLQGVYELPATVYTPNTGHRNIKVRAGIDRNGRSSDKAPYPFYTFYSTDRKLVKDSTTVVEPEFQYFDPQTKSISIWNENFDDPNAQKVTARPSSDTTLDRTQNSSEIFEGTASGKITLSSSRNFFLGASNGDFDFKKGNEVYLELDYRTRDTINVGILAEYPGKTIKRSYLNLTATERNDGSLYWNKIYVRLTKVVSEEAKADSYEVYLQSTLQEGVNARSILVDNFKVLYQDP